MEKERIPKLELLFIMVTIFLSGAFIGNRFEYIVNLIVSKVAFSDIISAIWVLGALITVICSFLGIYYFAIKGRSYNFYILTFLFLSSIEFFISGNKLYWTFGSLGFNIMFCKYFGIGYNLPGIILLIWYIKMIKSRS